MIRNSYYKNFYLAQSYWNPITFVTNKSFESSSCVTTHVDTIGLDEHAIILLLSSAGRLNTLKYLSNWFDSKIAL